MATVLDLDQQPSGPSVEAPEPQVKKSQQPKKNSGNRRDNQILKHRKRKCRP